jgi:putative Holliday junction resolvase
MLKTIKYSQAVPYNDIVDIIINNKVSKVVVGYPKNMNGTIGESARLTDEFIDELNKSLNQKGQDLEIIRWDERLTTVAAIKLMTETNVKTKQKKGRVDMIASQYLLQGYLDFNAR